VLSEGGARVCARFSFFGALRDKDSTDRPAAARHFACLTSILGKEYHFFVMGGIDSELEKSESRAAQKTKPLSPFLPIYMAFRRKHPDAYKILLTNILLAWTGEGWIVLWIWVHASGQNQKGSKKGGSNGKIA